MPRTPWQTQITVGPPPPPEKFSGSAHGACYKECGERDCAIHVCMQTFYLHVQFGITVNFQVQNPIVLFESCKKKTSYFLCIVLSYKKKIKIFMITLCKVIRDFL